VIELIKSPINGYSCRADPGEPGAGTPRLSINDTEGRIISELVRGLSVLEIGTGLGVSTRWLASTARRVLTLDCDSWVQDHIWPTLPASVICLRELRGARYCLEAAFIDGSHQYQAVMTDITLAMLNVKPGGLLIFHDLYIADVERALVDRNLLFVHIQSTAGLALAWNEVSHA